ncbi:MAG: hypothetical protein ACRD2Y_04755 [Terriglobales bacterium]
MTTENEVLHQLKALTRIAGIQATQGMKLADAALLLDRAGLDRRSIADICGTTPDAIRATLSYAKRNNRTLGKSGGEKGR